MTRQELIREVGKRTEYSQKSVKEVLESLEEVCYEEMAKGEEVKLFTSVTLLGKEVPERVARNPFTGGEVVVPSHLAPRAKFGSVVKRILKGEEE